MDLRVPYCRRLDQLLDTKHSSLFVMSTYFPHGATAPSGPGPPYCRGFTIPLRHTTVGRTSLDEWSAQRRDLYYRTLITDRHPYPLRDSNPQSQQAIGHSLTP